MPKATKWRSRTKAGLPVCIGTEETVSFRTSLSLPVWTGFCLTMGSNFGDLDNDGFLDIYFGIPEPYVSSRRQPVLDKARRQQ